MGETESTPALTSWSSSSSSSSLNIAHNYNVSHPFFFSVSSSIFFFLSLLLPCIFLSLQVLYAHTKTRQFNASLSAEASNCESTGMPLAALDIIGKCHCKGFGKAVAGV